MTLFHELKHLEKPLINPVITIGNFDGVHKGHLALFNKVKERAEFINGLSTVITFDPHPLKLMKPGNGPPLITPTREKLSLIEDQKIDVVFCLSFNNEFAAISAYDFVKTILMDTIGMKEIVVGYDYSFGHRREGNIELLHKLGHQLGFAVHVVEPVRIEGSLVSSTAVRKLVRGGELSKAKNLLGRNYQICGTVVKGKNRGARLLGFPTANLKVIDELTPKTGVYAVTVQIGDRLYKGATNIGYNPTFEDGAFSIETHILNFKGDLLNQFIRINFIKRLRSEKKFESVEALSDQLAKDVHQADKILKIE